MKKLITLAILLFGGLAVVSQTERTVIVEHFTNTRCGICAARNPGLYALLDNYPQVLHMAYHPSSPYSNCEFNVHNPQENDARTNYYGIYGGTPRIVLQGEVVTVQNPLLNAGQLEEALGQESDYMLDVKQNPVGDNEVNVRMIVKRVSNNQSDQLLLRAVIAEKEVNYNAPNGENLHHDVFRRELITEDPATMEVGDSLVYNETYDIHPDWVRGELFITLILQDESSREILQSAASPKLDAGTSSIIDNEIRSADGLVYPNPADQLVNIAAPEGVSLTKAEIYAMTGKRILSFDKPQSIEIGEMTEGVYLLILTDENQYQYITRLIKK